MTSLKQQHATHHRLSALCAEAVQQQIARGEAQPSQLRQRRRHLLKALRKRLPKSAMHAPQKILHTALMVLAMWGFSGLTAPNTAQADAVFEHVMLEGVYVGPRPTAVFVDIDNDGDKDLFAGNGDGKVDFFQNTGTATVPNFVAADGVSVINPMTGFDIGYGASPAFGDIENDGDLDLFVGDGHGAVWFFLNQGTSSSPAFVPANGYSIVNPMQGKTAYTDGARPTLIDIDNDGDLDLFLGESGGAVKFFKNTGDIHDANFVLANGYNTDGGNVIVNPLAIDVGTQSYPTFADIDDDGDFDAIVADGNSLRLYRNTGTASAPNFVADSADNPLDGVDSDWPAPFLADIDDDGDLDAFVSTMYATVEFYRNTGSASAPAFVSGRSGPTAQFDTDWASSPDFADIDNDGDLDMFVGEEGGSVLFYQNNGTNTAPEFVAADGSTVFNPLAAYAVSGNAQPTFADIDNDGDLDAFVGEYSGRVKFYRNNGTDSAPLFSADEAGNPLAGVNVYGIANPAFVDIDNDGDLDVFVGEYYGTVKFYQNNGTALVPDFVAADGDTIVNPLAAISDGNLAPAFADLDRDGDLDAFVGNDVGKVMFYRNIGTASAPDFVAANGTTVINPLDGFDVGHYATPTFADIDHDGDLDAFIGNEGGKVKMFENFEAQPPVAVNDSASTDEDTVLTGNLLANDTDINGNTLSAEAGTFTTAGGGSITINADGSYTYTPVANFNGSDSVDYIVSDGYLTDIGTLTITVNAVNDAPVAVADSATADEDSPLNSSVSLVANDTDIDGDTLNAVAGTYATTQGGSITIDTDGSYTYTPADNFNGTDTVDYTVTDGGLTAVATLTITVSAVNDEPVAVNDSASTDEDTLHDSSVSLLANDSDADGDSLSVTAGTFTTTQGGSITIATDGSYRYTPPANFNGVDTVEYTVSDDSESTVATLTITVNAVNDAPVAVNDSATTDEDTVFNSSINLVANDSDIEGDTLSAVSGTFATSQGGSIVISADGSYSYTPAANFNGDDTVDYTVSDGSLTSVGTLTITVNAINDAPVAVNDSATTDKDVVLDSSVSLLANDSDADGDSLSVTAGTFTTIQGGSITFDTDGSYSYTPPADYHGIDTVDYAVSDGSLSDGGTLTITVNTPSTGSSSSGGGGGGAFGLGMLWALMPVAWRRRRSA